MSLCWTRDDYKDGHGGTEEGYQSHQSETRIGSPNLLATKAIVVFRPRSKHGHDLDPALFVRKRDAGMCFVE